VVVLENLANDEKTGRGKNLSINTNSKFVHASKKNSKEANYN
jgi:hypothetical protein